MIEYETTRSFDYFIIAFERCGRQLKESLDSMRNASISAVKLESKLKKGIGSSVFMRFRRSIMAVGSVCSAASQAAHVHDRDPLIAIRWLRHNIASGLRSVAARNLPGRCERHHSSTY